MSDVFRRTCQGDSLVCFYLHSHSHALLQESDLVEIVRHKQVAEDDSNDTATPTQTVTLRRNNFRSSTKLEALLQNLSMYSFVYQPTVELRF